MKITNILNYFKYPNTEIRIIGSFNDDNLRYYSDIDLDNKVYYNQRGYKPLLTFFQRIFNKAYSKRIYITDFKAGFFNGYVLRWNQDDLNQGYQKLSKDYHFRFVDVFKQKSIIKIDFIVMLDDVFTEFSINYYFYFKDFDTRPEIIQQHSLTMYQDYKRYMESKDYYKATKRLYKFFKTIKDKVNVNRIVKFLNSEVGKYSYLLSSLNTMKFLMEFDEDIPFYLLKKSLRKLLSDSKYQDFSDKISNKNHIILLIDTIIKLIKPNINEESFRFLHSINSKDIIVQLYKHNQI
jgi:hypothetical protein